MTGAARISRPPVGILNDWRNAVVAAFLLCLGLYLDAHGRVTVWRIAVAAATFGTAFAIAGEVDAPLRLPEAEVVQDSGRVEHGRLIASSPSAVYLGSGGDLREIRAADIDSVQVSALPDESEADRPSSLGSRLLDLF